MNTTPNDGGPIASSVTMMNGEHGSRLIPDGGMSLRDWFAGMALQGQMAILDNRTCPSGRDVEEWRAECKAYDACYCYAMADAMLAARKGGA